MSNKVKIFYLTLFYLLLITHPQFSQSTNIIFERIGTENGLSQNQVTCIYSDNKGLIWFGTNDGLNLFDGYDFKIIKHEPGNQNSLPDYAVNTICETGNGIFWIGTMSGLSRFDLKTESFKHFIHDPNDSSSLPNNMVWRIVKDNSNNLWICTSNGLSKFDPGEEKFTNYKFIKANENSLSNNFVTSVLQDSRGNIWIGTRGGLDYFDEKGNRFYRNKINTENPSDVYSNGVISLAEHNNKLLVGTYSALYSTDLNVNINNNKKFNLIYKNPGRRVGISCISTGSNGSVWFTTTGEGLFRYFPASGKIINYKNSDVENSISENYLLVVFEDPNKVLWVGTNNSGVNKHSIYSEQFITYRLPKTSNTKFGDSRINALLPDGKGNLWIGTESGLIARKQLLNTNNESVIYLNEVKNLAPVEVTSIYQDREEKIWITTFGNGVYFYDPLSDQTRFLKQDKNNSNSLSNNFTHTVFESSDGTIWIGTGAGGLNKFDKSTGSFTVYKHNPLDSSSLSSNQIIAICEDDDGFLWIGTTHDGLNKFNPITGNVKRYTHNVDDLSSLTSNRINSLLFDSKSNLWIGTFGGGLNIWVKDEDNFRHYTTDNGLPSNTIQKALEDSFGNLWLSTDKGISRFIPESGEFNNYDANDGLQGNHFLRNSGFSDQANGQIYFGGVNGLNIFNPSQMLVNQRKPQIVITGFKIFNKEVKITRDSFNNSPLKRNILFAEGITLSYEDNFISFEFASLDFNNPDKNQYAYIMEGFNKDWINAGNQRTATFTNLDPGEYTFRVKATNSNGVWNEEGISIGVTLRPPWWQTWWAFLIYTAAIGAILLFIRQFEIKRVKLRNELELREVEAKKLQEVDKLKSRFFANISHEFRTPLTLILGLSDKLLKKSSEQESKKDFGVIKKNANRLLQLINQLLELSKLEAGNVNLRVAKYDINKFLRRILSSFSSIAEQKNITFTFNNNPLSDSVKSKEVYLYIDPEKFETIVSNLISNALKFSPSGARIEVEVIPHLHQVDLRFTNTGVGIPEDKLPFIFNRFYQVDQTSSRAYEGTGIGLALVKELVELHNGEISVHSIEEKETTFTIRIPVGRAHYKPEQVIVTDAEEKDTPEYSERLNYELEEQRITSEEIDIRLYGTSGTVKDSTDAKIILVVEDNSDLRNYITEQLEERYLVYEAEDGEQGLQKAAEILPDLIISDIMMPKMDGYEMSRKLKKDFKTSHIPIIMLTAKAAKEDKIEGLEIGADDYLVKPFDHEELLIRVKNLIKLREQMREKFRSEMILQPKSVIVPSSEKIFLDKISEIIENRIDDENFGVIELGKEIGLSRSQLHRKLKAVCDQTTTEFIRNFRLQRAADLIKQNAGNMAEIAYKVGFSSQAYFTKSFTELFGCPPSEYRKKKR